MKRILVPVGCRSDAGLSAPVIKRLRLTGFDVEVLQLEPQQFIPSYQIAEYFCKAERQIGNPNPKKPDLMFITGDRVEMCAAAAAAFHNKIPIAHFYAGTINDPVTTYDDIDRHVITLWSDIQFCENIAAAENVWDLKSSVALPHENIHEVGISHLDDLGVDESMVPDEPYELRLINAESFPKERRMEDYLHGLKCVQIGGNPDGEIEKVSNIFYPNLPRQRFLGLLKNCQRFITNSSAAIYEAPHFLKPEQIVMVGDRNRNRPRGPFQTGASDRIVAILKEWLK